MTCNSNVSLEAIVRGNGYFVGFEVITTVTMKVVTSCSSENVRSCNELVASKFRVLSFLLGLTFGPEDGGFVLFGNVGLS
jgi:hypothetical protein